MDQTKPCPTQTQSTENMLVNAANVDPFLEGRRPRHVWSHQLRLRAPAPASTVTTSDNGGNIHGNNSSSCLGPGGEQALFESLSSGAEGAFVAWVKGGHETRQECKRLVVDVLDLLAAPGGQTPSFFQRGVQAKRAPAGRMGIAAKGKGTATVGVVVAPKGGSGEDDLSVSKVVHENDGDRRTTARNGDAGGAAAPETTVVSDRRVVEDPHERERGRTRAILEKSGVGRSGGDATVAEQEGSGLTYGYASLRRIRERDPLPEVGSSKVDGSGFRMFLTCQEITRYLTACEGNIYVFFRHL